MPRQTVSCLPPLLTEPASLYESILVYKHIKISVGQISDPSKNQTARQPEAPASVECSRPARRRRTATGGEEIGLQVSVLFLGTGVHVNWTNLPLRPIFLPLVSQLVFELADVEQSSRSILAGQPLQLQFAKAAAPLGVEVVPPSGEIVRLKTQTAPGKTGQEFRYAETYEIGVYLLRLLDAADAAQIAYSVNVDPAEADPAKIARADLEKLYTAPLLFAENPDDLSGTFKTLREGKSLWAFFLAAVLFVLVFETFLSNWLGPKKAGKDK